MASVLICDLWENIPVPHAPFQIPHPTFHIQHPTSNIQHSTFHIQHSTFSTLLPQIYTVFPVAPRPASKYAILSASLQPPDNQPFTFRRPRATFSARPSPPRNAIFRPTITALSRLHPLPFAPRSLSPRNPIHAQRPRHPSLTAFPPVPNSPPNPQNRASPPSVSPKIPTPHFHQISLPSALRPHRLYDSVECKVMGSQFSVGVTTALGGEKKGSTTSN